MTNPSVSLSEDSDGNVVYELETGSGKETDKPSLASDVWTLVDTETDGLYAPIFVVELAAQKFNGLLPVGKPFRVFINHGIEIPEGGTAVHGYTTEFIVANGIDPKNAYSAFREYVGESYIAAHYLIFDWDRVLVPELQRLNEAPIGKRGFCTWFLCRRALPEFKTHKLDYLREVFELNCSGAHTAKGDVEAVVDLLTRIVFPRLGRAQINDIISIADFSHLTPLARCRELVQSFEIGVRYKDISYERPLTEYQVRRKQQVADELGQLRLIALAEDLLRSASCSELFLKHGMMEESPDIAFVGETFLFTGTMLWGSRRKAEREIVSRGGKLSLKRYVAPDIDYLVLGEDPENGWLSRGQSGKLEDAFRIKFKNPTSRLKIIREQDFLAAL